MDNKKNKIISSISILLLIVMMVGATYAYLPIRSAENIDFRTSASTNTTDSLVFNVDSDISLFASPGNFNKGMGNKEGRATASAVLKANNKTNNATDNYYLYLDIIENEFTYTTEGNTAELILQVTGPDGLLENGDIAGLNYVTVTDGKGESISGFDITEVQDLITIVSNKEITTTSEKVDTWEINVVLINLNEDQSGNGGKKFISKIDIQKESKISKGIVKGGLRNYTGEIWGYRDQIKEIVFEDEIISHPDAEYTFNIAESNEDKIMAYMYKNADNTYKVYIQAEGKIRLNTDSSFMFYKFTILENVIGAEKLDLSQTTSIVSMFDGCEKLENINVSNWDTSNVIDMNWVFGNCYSLKSLDVSKWNTSKVTDMYYLFANCKELIKLDVRRWDTSQVTNMGFMFGGCNKLSSIDVSNFDTSNVTNMRYMFNSCNNLTRLDLSSFDTSQVTEMMYMFSECNKLSSIDVSNFDTSKVTNMSFMFCRCNNLTRLDLSGFDTSKVTDIRAILSECSSLTNLDFRNAIFTSATSYNMMFSLVPSSINVIVKDNNAKTFIESRLAEANGGTVTIA